jgi:hypothetical protein
MNNYVVFISLPTFLFPQWDTASQWWVVRLEIKRHTAVACLLALDGNSGLSPWAGAEWLTRLGTDLRETWSKPQRSNLQWPNHFRGCLDTPVDTPQWEYMGSEANTTFQKEEIAFCSSFVSHGWSDTFYSWNNLISFGNGLTFWKDDFIIQV